MLRNAGRASGSSEPRDSHKQGIIASKIAARRHCQGVPHARDIDDKMGDARRVLD